MTYQYILFDLDGTLTESGPGIINSAHYALTKMGYKVENKDELSKFVGPPLTDSMKRFYDMTDEEAKQAIAYYREYYEETGIFENSVYHGVQKVVKKLKDAGKVLAIATSKPEVYAIKIAEYFGFAKDFTKICGATLDESSRVEKADVITYTLKTLKIEEIHREKILMIGDRKYDILGAKENGIDSMGVLYGYGSREELEKAGADYLAHTVSDVSEIILRK